MAQDCFLTFGICRQMIMMQPGKLSILPLESKQWGSTGEETKTSFDVKLNITMTVICAIPYDISTKASNACYLCYIDSTATSLTFGANTVPYGYGWIAIGKQ